MDSPAQWLADYDKKLARAAANARAASESLSRMSGTASSPRGEVTVQVGPSGAMEDIRLTPAARALEAEQLARLILTTAQQAQRSVGAQVVEIMTDYVGDGPALDFVKQNMPPAAGVDASSGPPPPDDDDYFFANPQVIVR
ncbi:MULTISPECIES: YbaB/EbfC family nucleoid-associated protein [Saccharopolyspora]|uniref:YbaB/EbfC DNA-binding family protein n=1 Tax=Saccharopolyspora shandongensis TaxID=418495 RepID=A0A1H3KZX5_9PSEU|nr:YbaB/EbfC family nucleoid-associated protein [Saccharopolyspora shandongensis]SDY57566.1 YbaB/EbfC DNA-binding family protein [Saccharopolyspora shandongensis]